jgi:hypothetical protein
MGVGCNMQKVTTVKDFMTIFFIVGVPFIPGTGIPFLLLVLFLKMKEVLNFINGNRRAFVYITSIALIYTCYSLIVASAIIDFMFSMKLIVKFFLLFFSSIIVAFSVYRSPKSLLTWLILQSIFIFLSVSNYDFYIFALNFISPDAVKVFSEIYFIRGLGFGLYHVDGALLFSFFSLLPLLLNAYPRVNFRYIGYFSLFFSILLARSSFIMIGLIGLIKKPVWLSIFLVAMLIVSPYIVENHGVLYEALELFRNYLDTGTVSSRSTDENLRMLIFPYEMEGWFHGEGFFFSEPSIFYRGTDLGWIRLLLFGGVPFVLIFIVLNLAPIFLMNKKQFSIKMILIALFFIMNFKGIFIISFFSGFIMTYLWLLNSSPCAKIVVR